MSYVHLLLHLNLSINLYIYVSLYKDGLMGGLTIEQLDGWMYG